MSPTLLPGDKLRVDRNAYGRARARLGEIVVVRDPDAPRRWLVKRVAAVGPGRFWLFRDRLERVTGADESHVPDGATEVVGLREDELFVLSDSLVGARDSRRFGPVAPSFVVGRVVYRTAPAARAGPL